MVRSYNDILTTTIAVIGLIMGIALYYLGLNNMNAETSVQGQPFPTTSLVQNGNTLNHFGEDPQENTHKDMAGG
jgi:hypothetical protein